MSETREAEVVDTFLALTDTLVHDFDALDMLTMLAERCIALLDVSAAGVILVDGQGRLSVAAASSERSRLLEVFAVAIDGGPCVDCVRTGEQQLCDDLTAADARHRWPHYAHGAVEAGFRATHALPMRLRDDVIGVLTLLHTRPHALSDIDARLGQALADAATIGLIHERAVRRAETVRSNCRALSTAGSSSSRPRECSSPSPTSAPARRSIPRRRSPCCGATPALAGSASRTWPAASSSARWIRPSCWTADLIPDAVHAAGTCGGGRGEPSVPEVGTVPAGSDRATASAVARFGSELGGAAWSTSTRLGERDADEAGHCAHGACGGRFMAR